MSLLSTQASAREQLEKHFETQTELEQRGIQLRMTVGTHSALLSRLSPCCLMGTSTLCGKCSCHLHAMTEWSCYDDDGGTGGGDGRRTPCAGELCHRDEHKGVANPALAC